VIGNFDIICEEITQLKQHETPMSINRMKNVLKYNKNITATLVYNEDFKNFILQHIKGIELIKVWQQEDEDNENGVGVCNINKVFLSYIPKVDDVLVDTEIVALIEEAVYGKPVIIRKPNVINVSMSIYITNNTKKSISTLQQERIKTELIGYYDDKDRRLTRNLIYSTIVDVMRGHDIDVDLTLSDMGLFLNADFYKVETENVTIKVSERV